MPKLGGHDVTILRIAGENDLGYDPHIPKVFIGDDRGEHLVLRSDIDERDDISDAELERMKERSKNPTDMAVEERRREARRLGMPPDQAPDPFITTATGRQVPNPDAIGNDGRAPVLEQAKQGQPTVPTGPGNQAISDRGDPRAGTDHLGPDAQRASSERAMKEDTEAAQRDREKEAAAAAQKAASEQQEHGKPPQDATGQNPQDPNVPPAPPQPPANTEAPPTALPQDSPPA